MADHKKSYTPHHIIRSQIRKHNMEASHSATLNRRSAKAFSFLIVGILVFVVQICVLTFKYQAHQLRHLQELESASASPPFQTKLCKQEQAVNRTVVVHHVLQRSLSRGEHRVRYDSRNSTVLAMAQGYKIGVHRRFVGSLRKSGFRGNILLATEPELQPGVEEYLLRNGVTILRLNYTECLHKILQDHEVIDHKDKECNTCIAPYNDVKIRWGRFPFLRDALQKCKTCTGPVLVTDVRDTFFQRDPFGDGAPDIEGLHLFSEWRLNNAGHSFIQVPILKCKSVELDKSMGPMICSGTTIGTRATMIGYLDAMYNEMVEWMKDKNCWSKKAGGDQAVHNYLYYTGKLDHLRPVVFAPREGIVNTVGAQGVQFSKIHYKIAHALGRAGHKIPYIMSDPERGQWLPVGYDITDMEGYFIDFNGERSRVVHQYDRFGNHVQKWLNQNEGKIWA